MDLLKLLKEYNPSTDDQKLFVSRMEELLKQKKEKAFLRENEDRHFTASAFVLSSNRQKVLLMLHKKLRIWVQPGGHADGELDLRAVAQKELLEETGVEAPLELDQEIFHLDIHEIPEVAGVKAHEHYDVRFLFFVPEEILLQKNEESLDLRWFSFQKLKDIGACQSVLKMAELSMEQGYLRS